MAIENGKNAVEVEIEIADEEAAFGGGFEGKDPPKNDAGDGKNAVASEANDGKGNEPPKEGASGQGEPHKPGVKVETEEYVKLTPKQYQELLAMGERAIRLETRVNDQFAKAFGSIGGMQAAINKITKGGEVDQKALADLKAEFPELGGHIERIVAKKVEEVRDTGPKPLSSEDLEKVYQARRDKEKMDEIEEEHPKWRDTVGRFNDYTNPFRKWARSQGAEFEARLNASQSPRFIISALDKFKADQAKAQAESTNKNGAGNGASTTNRSPSAPNRQPNAQARRDRVASAVTPRGVAPTQSKPKSEADSFAEGFNTR